MARDEIEERVLPYRGPHRPGRFRPSDPLGDIGIESRSFPTGSRAGLAKPSLEKSSPSKGPGDPVFSADGER